MFRVCQCKISSFQLVSVFCLLLSGVDDPLNKKQEERVTPQFIIDAAGQRDYEENFDTLFS